MRSRESMMGISPLNDLVVKHQANYLTDVNTITKTFGVANLTHNSSGTEEIISIVPQEKLLESFEQVIETETDQ